MTYIIDLEELHSVKCYTYDINTAPFSRKDHISQEITILQVINSKDKSNYLKSCDLGFMYFPHPTFIPMLRNVDSTLKEVKILNI